MTIISFGSFYLGMDDYQFNDFYLNQNQGVLTMHLSFYRLELECPLLKRNRGPTA